MQFIHKIRLSTGQRRLIIFNVIRFLGAEEDLDTSEIFESLRCWSDRERERESSVGFSGSPNNGRYYSHTTELLLGNGMGIVNGKLTMKGVPWNHS